MRSPLAVAVALLLGLQAPGALAAPERSAPISNAAVGARCEGAGAAHTAEVAARSRTVDSSWTIGVDRGIGLALSRDGGRTYSRRAVPFTTCTGGPLEYAFDPDLALGADGTPWLSASGNLPASAAVDVSTGDREGRVLVAVGDQPAVSAFPGVTVERGFLETDATNPSRGWVLTESISRVFVTAGPAGGRGFSGPGPGDALLIGRTEDRGRTWTRSVVRTAAPGTSVIALGLVRVGGALVALSVQLDYKDPAAVSGLLRNQAPASPIVAQASTDAGATWSDPVTIGVPRQPTLVDAAAGAGLVAVAAPQRDGSLLVWTSEDVGRTWRQVTAAGGVAQPAAGVAVDPRGRVVVLSYAAAGNALTPQVSTSRDRGRTFARPVPLARPFDRTTVASGSHVSPFGPYNGADADGSHVRVAFVADENRDGRTETRTARVP